MAVAPKKSMTKSQLVTHLAEKTGLTRKESAAFMEALTSPEFASRSDLGHVVAPFYITLGEFLPGLLKADLKMGVNTIYSSSVKDRLAISIIEEAERRGFATADILHARGALNFALAEEAKSGGEDPKPLYIEAEEHLWRAASLFPEDSRFLDALGYLLMFRMDVEEPGGAAYNDAYRRAERALARAAGLSPRSGSSLSTLGLLHIERSRTADRGGEDPRPFLHKAVTALERSIAIEAHPIGYFNLGNAHGDRGFYEARTGGDPAPHFERCVEAQSRALAANADFIPALRERGNCRAELLRIRLETGR